MTRIKDAVFSSRQKLVDELRRCTLDDDGTGRRLIDEIASTEKRLAELRIQLNVYDKERGCKAIEVSRRQSEIKSRLLSTADPSIGQAVDEMQERINQGERARNYGSSRDNLAIESWLAPAKLAIRQLAELKLTALGGDELEQAIRSIIENVPASW